MLAYDHLLGAVGRADPEFATFGRGLVRLCDWAVDATLAEQEGALATAVAEMDGVTEDDVARIREAFRAKLAVEPVPDEQLAELGEAHGRLVERKLMPAEDPVGAWAWGMRWGLLDGFARGGHAVGLPPRDPAPEAGPEPPEAPTPTPPTYRVVGAVERPARLNGWKPLWQRRAIEHGPGEADDLFAENAPYTKLPYQLLDGEDNAPSLRNVDGHWLDEQALDDELPTTYSFKLPEKERLYHYVFQLTELSEPPAGSWADWALKIAEWLSGKEDDLADGAGKLVGGAVAAVAPPAADIAKEIVKGLTKLAINVVARQQSQPHGDPVHLQPGHRLR